MKVLFITRRSSNCGVADYGKRLFSILQPAMDITLREIEGPYDVPEEYNIALVNYHHATIPWPITRNPITTKKVMLFHEGPVYDHTDLLLPVEELPRPLYPNLEWSDEFHPYKYRIGSFGFGFPDKNYLGIAKMVKREFGKAILRLHIPFAEFGDEIGDMAKDRVQECRNELEGSGIDLEVKHGFMEPSELIQWLNENSINIFNCIPTHGRGISSSIDYALSARRPIGISNSEMYRHLPREICTDNISLPRLIAKGIEPLRHIYDGNTHEKLIEAVRTKLGI